VIFPRTTLDATNSQELPFECLVEEIYKTFAKISIKVFGEHGIISLSTRPTGKQKLGSREYAGKDSF
jgi:hypothetical protein